MWKVAPSAALPAVLVTSIVGWLSTEVVSVSELSPRVLSFGDETVAVFDKTCSVAGAVTLIVITGALEFAAIEARVQVIVVVPEQVQPIPEAEPVMPPGSGSETLTEVAATVVELFETVNV